MDEYDWLALFCILFVMGFMYLISSGVIQP